MAASIVGIGHQRRDGSPTTLIRRAYPLHQVAVVVRTAGYRHICLAEHVDPTNVARVLRHLETAHPVPRGAVACYAPACAVAVELGGGDAGVDASPTIASSA